MFVALVPLQTVQKAEAGDTETIGKSDPETENEDDEDTKKVMKFLMEGVEEIDDDAMYQESLSLTIAAKWNLSEEDPENALKLMHR